MSLDETIALLPKKQQDEIRLFLKSTNPRWYATNSFAYKYNGKSVYRLNFTKLDSWRINLTLDKYPNLDLALLGISDDLRSFYFEHIRKCKHCNPAHGNGGKFIILGNEFFGCGEPEIEMENPTINEIQILLSFIEIRKDIIKQQNPLLKSNQTAKP